jgi:hypothetical protein
MKIENIFKPWASREAFEKALAEAPDWADDADTRDGAWANPRVTMPGQNPFETSSTTIAEQLGIPAAGKIAVINGGDANATLRSLIPTEKIASSVSSADLVLLFVCDQQDFNRLLSNAADRLSLDPGATLWLCHPRHLTGTVMLKDAEELGLFNDAFLVIDSDWVCLRLRHP